FEYLNIFEWTTLCSYHISALSAVMGLCFVLGVPGNVAVLVMLVRRLKEKNFTLSLMLRSTCHFDGLCPILYIWCAFCSTFCVTLMSFQRYMQVLHPQIWAKLGDHGKKGLLAGIWILSGLLASYIPVQRDVGCTPYGFQYCYQQFKSDSEKLQTSLLEMFQFFICFFLLAIFYYCLHRGVNQSPFFSSNRLTKLVTLIVLAFFMFYAAIPLVNILNIIAISLENESLLKTFELAGRLARAITFLSGCVNPFLYKFSFRGSHLRAQRSPASSTDC
uniref:Zgc:194202 n=1 Tax=Astyanax mexicanus TaxID=7994 RepID=A0A8B9GQL2_ASTMX